VDAYQRDRGLRLYFITHTIFVHEAEPLSLRRNSKTHNCPPWGSSSRTQATENRRRMEQAEMNRKPPAILYLLYGSRVIHVENLEG
jgi:hypothetical protein